MAFKYLLKIDEMTYIRYEDTILTNEDIVGAHDQTNATLEEQVLRDIMDIPLEIVRENEYEDLRIQASIVPREGRPFENHRPYKEIVLAPVKERLTVESQKTPLGSRTFDYGDSGPDHVAFYGMKSLGFDVKIFYGSE